MKLYHYVPKGSRATETGLFSFAKSPRVNLDYYIKRSGCHTQATIAQWMDGFFPGYSRGVRVLKEPLKWHPKCLRLKEFIDENDLLEIDVTALHKAGLIEAVYYNPPLRVPQNKKEEEQLLHEIDNRKQDGFVKITLADISTDPVDYSVCDDESGRRFAFLPFYLLVMKDGVIPPKYLKIIHK
ncbi:MAG: hypothetical protein ILP11_00520 [Alphaproteobacteria bacterium]|nr:hypothetical protein [Alphaproteobacteria bacterium]